jgi:hypothetical protein
MLIPPMRTVLHKGPATAFNQHILRKTGADSKICLRFVNQSWGKLKVLKRSCPKVTFSFFTNLLGMCIAEHDWMQDSNYSRLNFTICIRDRYQMAIYNFAWANVCVLIADMHDWGTHPYATANEN